jgi:hypothetical protein
MARSLGVLALAASCQARHQDTGALLLTSRLVSTDAAFPAT